jgi:hypothetical protein
MQVLIQLLVNPAAGRLCIYCTYQRLRRFDSADLQNLTHPKIRRDANFSSQILDIIGVERNDIHDKKILVTKLLP